MPIITGWATLFCATLFIALTFRVIAARRASGVAMGDGGDETLLRRMRGQANAAEQMPITLIALLVTEISAGSGWLLGLFALIFCAGRLAHGIAFGWMMHNMPLRVSGMIASTSGTGLILIHLAFALLFGMGS